MNSFKQYLLSLGQGEKTVESSHYRLCHFLTWCDATRTGPDMAIYTDILAYIKYLKEKRLKQRSIQTYLNSLRHYYDWLIKRGLRGQAGNPVSHITLQGIKRRSLYHILKKHELEALYHGYAPKAKDKREALKNSRDKTILGLMAYQGLTTTDLNNLATAGINPRKGLIEVPGSRNSNPRTLALHAHQVLDTAGYIHNTRPEILKLTRKQTGKLLVTTGSGHNIHNALQRLMEKLKAQNKKVTGARQIRASVITYWLKHYNLRKVQYMAGHRYVSSTESYLVNDIDDLSKDIGRFHPID